MVKSFDCIFKYDIQSLGTKEADRSRLVPWYSLRELVHGMHESGDPEGNEEMRIVEANALAANDLQCL